MSLALLFDWCWRREVVSCQIRSQYTSQCHRNGFVGCLLGLEESNLCFPSTHCSKHSMRGICPRVLLGYSAEQEYPSKTAFVSGWASADCIFLRRSYFTEQRQFDSRLHWAAASEFINTAHMLVLHVPVLEPPFQFQN